MPKRQLIHEYDKKGYHRIKALYFNENKELIGTYHGEWVSYHGLAKFYDVERDQHIIAVTPYHGVDSLYFLAGVSTTHVILNES